MNRKQRNDGKLSLEWIGTYYQIEKFVQKHNHWIIFDQVATLWEVRKIAKDNSKLTLRYFKVERIPMGRIKK